MCGIPSPRTLCRQADREIRKARRRGAGRFGLRTRVDDRYGHWRAVLVEDVPVFFRTPKIHPCAVIEAYEVVLCELATNPPHLLRHRLACPLNTPSQDYDEEAEEDAAAERERQALKKMSDEFREVLMSYDRVFVPVTR